MMSVQGRVVRPIALDTFTDITAVPLVLPEKGERPRDGLLFADDLTPEQVGAVWWRMTSTDDDDMTRRQSLAALRDTNDPGLCAALVAYVLGEAL